MLISFRSLMFSRGRSAMGATAGAATGGGAGGAAGGGGAACGTGAGAGAASADGGGASAESLFLLLPCARPAPLGFWAIKIGIRKSDVRREQSEGRRLHAHLR